MTIDSKEIILKMLRNSGFYPGDPQAYAIYTYTNAFGKQTWKVMMHEAYLEETSYVRTPILLWNKDEGLTPDGEDFLKENQNEEEAHSALWQQLHRGKD